jgi:hypothetical protein
MSHHYYRLALLAALLAVGATGAAAWPPGGVIAAPFGGQDEPLVLRGENCSVLAIWSDSRWLDNFDLYGQLLLSTGQIAPGWPDTGLMIARAAGAQRTLSGISHPDGSFILGIADYRNFFLGGTGADTYITRVLPSGEIDPAWPRQGFQAIDRPGDDGAVRMIWVAPDTLMTGCAAGYPGDGTPRPLLQLVAVTPAGPQSLWGSEGIRYAWLPYEILTTFDLVPDQAGGAYVLFDQYYEAPAGAPAGDLYLMRVDRQGQPAAGWETGPKPVCVAPGNQELARAVSDSNGGVYVVWSDARNGAGLPSPDYLDYEDIRLQRFDADGSPHGGWPGDGLVVSDAPYWQTLPSLVADDAGGVYVSYQDVGIGLTHVRADATFAPGWAKNGIQLSTLFAYLNNPRMVMDGSGGVFVMFEDFTNNDLYVQHALATGHVDPMWPSIGYNVSNADRGDIVQDGAGGCYTAGLTNLTPTTPSLVVVRRFGVDGPVPVKLAEATADAEPGRVHIVWRGTDGAAADARVQRRDDAGSGWHELGAPVALGRDAMAFDDVTATAGASYAYRLVRGAEVLSQEVSVRVPLAAVFAFSGPTRNPAPARELAVAFSLAGAGVARLEVLDLAGRREYARDLAGLSPGRQTLALADARLAPGVHWLQLTEGTKSAHARVVVIK